MALGSALVVEWQRCCTQVLCSEIIPLHLWCLFAALGVLFGKAQDSLLFLFYIYNSSDKRKRNLLCGWNSLTWFSRVELSIAVEFGHGESEVGCRRLDATSRECMWEGSRKSGAHR